MEFNPIALFLSAIVTLAVGFIWYNPKVFGTIWMRENNLTPEDLERRGRHPSFGPVTLSQLLAAWATHDLTHLHQISRILAHQYHETVGPWQKFLGVLHCDGHSSPS